MKSTSKRPRGVSKTQTPPLAPSLSTHHGERGSPAADADYLDDGDSAPVNWSHYMHAPLRRPFMVLVPWVAVLLLSIIVFFVLPKRYKSSTLILVESEKVPESFVPKMATEDISRRLDSLWPEILSRTRLERVLEDTHPYPDIDSKTRAVEKMLSATRVFLKGSDSFAIEFVHTNPQKAQEVTDRIARLFIEETIKSREQQVEGAVDFLVTQVNDSRQALEKKDEKLREYKEAHMGRLPEQLQTNLATMGMLQQELRSVEEGLFFAREKRDALARGNGRSSTAGTTGGVPTAPDELDELRRQLASLRARYTDDHPDMQSLRSRIARLEERRAALQDADATAAVEPSALAAREQYETATLEVKRLEDRRADLERRLSAIRSRVDETPRTEQELANLKRDYDNLNENYVALLAKQLEAQMAGRLERRWKGEHFRMLDPANLPERPYFPSPLIIIGLGAIVGLLSGLGISLLVEYLDPSIKDASDLETMLTHPVLARIPHLPSLGAPSTR
jgi:succinoglycan biosynthesis transport protein ExoP